MPTNWGVVSRRPGVELLVVRRALRVPCAHLLIFSFSAPGLRGGVRCSPPPGRYRWVIGQMIEQAVGRMQSVRVVACGFPLSVRSDVVFHRLSCCLRLKMLFVVLVALSFRNKANTHTRCVHGSGAAYDLRVTTDPILSSQWPPVIRS